MIVFYERFESLTLGYNAYSDCTADSNRFLRDNSHSVLEPLEHFIEACISILSKVHTSVYLAFHP